MDDARGRDRDEPDGEDVEAAAQAFLTASRALLGIAVRSVAAAPVPLTVPQHRLLVLVASDGGRRVGALADDLGVNQSNASRLVDRLERQGLVRRVRDVEDGRAATVDLTGAGRRVMEAVNRHRVAALRPVLEQMDPDLRGRAVEVLQAFNAAAREADAAIWPI